MKFSLCIKKPELNLKFEPRYHLNIKNIFSRHCLVVWIDHTTPDEVLGTQLASVGYTTSLDVEPGTLLVSVGCKRFLDEGLGTELA
jgi:hypothetical protein